MSDSVWPHRRQPTRLPCPWDSPGKNTGVGCHFFLQCMKVKSESDSNAWKWKVKVKSLSRVWLLAAPWTAAYQAPPSMGFSRQEYWSGVPLPSPEMTLKHMEICLKSIRIGIQITTIFKHILGLLNWQKWNTWQNTLFKALQKHMLSSLMVDNTNRTSPFVGNLAISHEIKYVHTILLSSTEDILLQL